MRPIWRKMSHGRWRYLNALDVWRVSVNGSDYRWMVKLGDWSASRPTLWGTASYLVHAVPFSDWI